MYSDTAAVGGTAIAETHRNPMIPVGAYVTFENEIGAACYRESRSRPWRFRYTGIKSVDHFDHR